MSAQSTESSAPAAHLAQRHIPALDGLRGFAAIVVMFFHFAFPPFQNELVQTGARRIIGLGQTGVDLFFVLSGFLITGILLDAKGSPGFLRNFYMRRVLRIMPLYYGVVIAYFTLPLFFGHPFDGRDFAIYCTYLQSIVRGFTETPIEGPGHFWSLAVEEHFYMLWPMLVCFLSEKQLRYALLIIVAGSILSRIYFLHIGIDVFYLTPCRFDAIAIGSFIALLYRNAASREFLGKYAPRIFIIAAAIFGPLYVVMSGSQGSAQRVYKYTIIAIIYAALLIMVVAPREKSWAARIFSWSPLRAAGKISYALYVFHPFVFEGIDHYLGKYFHGAPLTVAGFTFLKFVFAFALSFLAAWLSWHLFEKRFLSLKKYFEYKPGKASS